MKNSYEFVRQKCNGIYIVTDGKGGFLKINHYR